MFAGQPHANRYLHMAALDAVLALAAAAMHYNLFDLDLEHPAWKLIPAWVWPALAVFFLLSALWAYRKHRQLRRQRQQPR